MVGVAEPIGMSALALALSVGVGLFPVRLIDCVHINKAGVLVVRIS
jgi:hypothetical protein